MACGVPIFVAPANFVPAAVVLASVIVLILGAVAIESLRTPPWTLIRPLYLPPTDGSDASPWQNFHVNKTHEVGESSIKNRLIQR
jgi:hypothetical protein